MGKKYPSDDRDRRHDKRVAEREALEDQADDLGGLRVRMTDDKNHYTVVNSGWQPIGDLGDPQLNREVNFITAAMDASPDRFWWLSFCDGDLPKGQQFLGVAIIEAPNEIMAITKAHERGCNPGGQVAIVPMPEWAGEIVHPEERHVLLTKEQTEVFDQRVAERAG